MSPSVYIIGLLCLFTINVLRIESHSTPKDTITSILDDPFSDHHRKSLHALSGYRHRFEQSPNFKALRWSEGYKRPSDLCELCDIGVPLVS